MIEKRPFTTSPERDEDVDAVELVRRARQMKEAKRIKAESFVEPWEPVAVPEIVVNVEPVKRSSQAALFLQELKEEVSMEVKKTPPVAKVKPRQRVKAIRYPDGFHNCGDPLCGAHELIRLERERDRVRKSKASPSGRS